MLVATILAVTLLLVRSQVSLPSQNGVPGPKSPISGIRLENVDGGTLTVARRPDQPLVLYFMAAWCTACIPEARALADIYEQYGSKGLQVIAVDVEPDETPQNVVKFRTLIPRATYSWAIDRWGEAAQAFQVRYLDTTVVLDTYGNVVYRDEVPTDYNTLKVVVEKLLTPQQKGGPCC